jgi:alcohol dehydrogenase class IV
MPTMQFHLETKIYFGIEAIRELPAIGRVFGTKALVVTGKNAVFDSGLLLRVENLLTGAGISMVAFSEVEPEPSLETVSKGISLARTHQVDWVIGLGGGSAIDVAKVIAGLFHTGNELDYYFGGCKIEAPGIPLVTIPTTAGSGAEVTFNAVLSDQRRLVKKSIRDPILAAKATIVDPQLTFSMPESITVHSGIDALVQAIESYTSKGANEMTDIFAYSAIEKIGANIIKVYQDGQNVQARTEMSLGSLSAGIALGNARLGAVHGLAHPIGARTGKPHGLVCGVLLVPVMRFNLSVCYEKYARVAKALGLSFVAGGDPIDAAAAAIKAIMSLEKRLGVPTHIGSLEIPEADLLPIVEEALTSGSLKANPREAKAEDLLNILKESF